MGIRKRNKQANYLKVGENFEFLGTSFTNATEKPSPQTTSKRYIGDSASTQSIVSYEWSTDFEADQISSDKAVEFIRNIGEMQLTGADSETEYLIVDMDVEGNTEGTYRARKLTVAIQVDEFPDNDGEFGVSGSFLGKGDPVLGTFTKETKAFAEGFTPKTTV